MSTTEDPRGKDKTGAPPILKPDPIQDAIGQFGRWQLIVCLSIFLLKFPVAWHHMLIIFVAPPTKFTCENQTISKCSSECPRHEFDRSVFSETIISDWDLVCKYAQLSSVSQVSFMLGILIGSYVFGALSDKFGRRRPLVVAVIIQLVFGVLAAVIPWFWMYCVTRFIVGCATAGTMLSFVILMEICGVNYREDMAVWFHFPFNLGHLTLPLFAYFIRNWRWLQFALSIPSVILISYYWLVPESPRWLILNGRTEELTVLLTKAARINKRPTEGISERFKSIPTSSRTLSKGNIQDLLRTPQMRIRTLVMWYCWFVCGLNFYGISQYVGNIGGNIFLNVAISALISIPGTIICLPMLKYLGRKKTMIIANLFTGTVMLMIALLPPTATLPTLILASCGINGMNIAFPTGYLWASEVFPTVVRNLGVGTSSMAARFGTMIAPFVAGLALTYHWVPPLIFGIVPIIGAGLVFLMPETKGIDLPETLEDVEQLIVQKKS